MKGRIRVDWVMGNGLRNRDRDIMSADPISKSVKNGIINYITS